MNIFKELPIVFPFYDSERHLDFRKENRTGIFELISPKNALLPFQISLPTGKPQPTKWSIISFPSGSEIDITNNLSAVKVYEIAGEKTAVYFGDALQFVFEARNEPLNLPTGFYYSKFYFTDGSYFVSEIFFVPCPAFDAGSTAEGFFKIEFWNNHDLKPVIYRDDWKQILYLKTFVHGSEPTLEEETKKDGFNNEIPVFQKLILKYKFSEVVPDFVKVAIVSLQMQDEVYIETENGRSGKIDRVWVSTEDDEAIGMSVVTVTFEDDVLIKTACSEQPASVISGWV